LRFPLAPFAWLLTLRLMILDVALSETLCSRDLYISPGAPPHKPELLVPLKASCFFSVFGWRLNFRVEERNLLLSAVFTSCFAPSFAGLHCS